MLVISQFLLFIITSLIVFGFTSYLSLTYSLTYLLGAYKQWLFTEIDHIQLYDFIIVGAGTAGVTAAMKLTEYGHKVLLLEAGGVAPPFLDIPLLAPLVQNTPYDWKYVTVPQQNACKGLKNNQSKWPMGKILGGTNRINYMLHVRGHPSDYDWLPDYIRDIRVDHESMHVSNLTWDTGLADIILKGLEELDHNIGNINEDLKTGFMKVQLSMENGKRWCADELLYKYLKDKLTIFTHAHVEKVLMESNRAIGVQFFALNKKFKAFAKGGVVLSAGTIGTPKILMLSGIGPKEHLEDMKINVINDLPVGKHLVDHVLTGIDLVTLNTSIGLSITNAFNPLSVLDYFLFGEGPWTHTGVEVLGTFHSTFQENKLNVPDLQIMVMPLGVSQDNGVVLKETMGITDEVYNGYFALNSYKNTVTIAPVLLHPRSEGEIKLSSSNPLDPPLIDPKYLSNEDDVAILVDGIQFVKKLVKTNAMKTVGAAIYEKHFPGCENERFDSTEYWECYVQHLTLTSYHPAGTCRMGDVVDQTFKVYGTMNLYVIDASVFASLPSGNINAAVRMIAEKAVRVINQNTKVRMEHKVCFSRRTYRHIFNRDNICEQNRQEE